MGQREVGCKGDFGENTACFSSLIDNGLPRQSWQYCPQGHAEIQRTLGQFMEKNELKSVEWGAGEETDFLSACFQLNICSIKIMLLMTDAEFLGSQSVSLCSVQVL